MNAKELSEVVKNWITSLTLVGAFIITLVKGTPYIEEKKNEIAISNDIIAIKADVAKKSLQKIQNIESIILKKKELFDQEYTKTRGNRDNSLLDKLEYEINSEKVKKDKELESIKYLLEKNKL